MLLAVISDTHMPKGGRRLPADCVEHLRQAEMILHAGDLIAEGVLDELAALGPPVAAVHGNVDSPALRRRRPERRVVDAAGALIGMVHDAEHACARSGSAPHDGPGARRRWRGDLRAGRPGAGRAGKIGAVDLDVVFLGMAGSVPTASRGLPATLIRGGGERLVFDCGEGTQRQMVRSVGLVPVDDVLLTHFHADHVLGLPGLRKTYGLTDRRGR